MDAIKADQEGERVLANKWAARPDAEPKHKDLTQTTMASAQTSISAALVQFPLVIGRQLRHRMRVPRDLIGLLALYLISAFLYGLLFFDTSMQQTKVSPSHAYKRCAHG